MVSDQKNIFLETPFLFFAVAGVFDGAAENGRRNVHRIKICRPLGIRAYDLENFDTYKSGESSVGKVRA